MSCKRCPHLVKHGRVDQGNNVVFVSNCGLLMKAEILEAGGEVPKKPGRKPTKPPKDRPPVKRPPLTQPDGDYNCRSLPFPENFNYFECGVYRDTFKGGIHRAGVVPTKDFQFLSTLTPGSITDMELL